MKKKIKLPPKNATDDQLADFFDQYDGVELEKQGIMVIDPDTSDLDRMLKACWNEPNTMQLNIRIPASAKRRIESLAKRKAVEVSTLVRIWVMDSMRRETMDRR